MNDAEREARELAERLGVEVYPVYLADDLLNPIAMQLGDVTLQTDGSGIQLAEEWRAARDALRTIAAIAEQRARDARRELLDRYARASTASLNAILAEIADHNCGDEHG